MQTLLKHFIICAGIFLGIGLISTLSFDHGTFLLLGSLGSSSVLLFAFPESEFSKGRCVIGGHFVSSAIGLVFFHLFGATAVSLGVAVAASAAMMALLKVMHPPAGSNPIIVFLGAQHWGFLLFPTLFGCIALVSVAFLFHRTSKRISNRSGFVAIENTANHNRNMRL